jgi:hypothetical protein
MREYVTHHAARLKASGRSVAWPSDDIHRVAMSIVALARIVNASIAIHAARMLQDRRNLLE